MRTQWLTNQSMSIETVVFATDFSPASYSASVYATALAEHFRCTLLLIHVFIPSQSAQDSEAQSGLPSEDRKSRQQRLDLTANALKPRNSDVKSLLVEGDPSKMVPRVVNQMDRCLLVLGTHGGNLIERRLIGSVAENVLRQTCVPTVTVNEKLPSSLAPQLFQKMLYATDSSSVAAQAAPLACAFARSFSSQLEVIIVIEESEGSVSQVLAKLDFRTIKQMAQTVDGPSVDFMQPRSVRRSQHAHDEILRRIKTDDCDLLILGIEQKSVLGFSDHNSGAFRLIAAAPCPVLTESDGFRARQHPK
jgi:nucleotide-binding universal stress UspA family protein